MANLTLKIDDSLLEKARILAARKKTSVNSIVRQQLEAFVSGDLMRQAALEGLDAFYSRCRAKIGGKGWTRDEIHER